MDLCGTCGEAEIDIASNTLWCADCLARHVDDYRKEYEAHIPIMSTRHNEEPALMSTPGIVGSDSHGVWCERCGTLLTDAEAEIYTTCNECGDDY